MTIFIIYGIYKKLHCICFIKKSPCKKSKNKKIKIEIEKIKIEIEKIKEKGQQWQPR
jgi:hypothetical protein